MVFKSHLKQLGIRQNTRAELLAFKVDVSAISGNTNAGLLDGANYAVIQKTGTGTYTLTLNRTCARTIIVVGAMGLGEVFVRTNAATSTSQVFINIEADDGTDTDADFDLTLLCFFSDTER